MSANNSEAARVYILDSFAVLAYLEAESGMERVKTLLKAAQQSDCQIFMSLINLGEVLYITEREQGGARLNPHWLPSNNYPLKSCLPHPKWSLWQLISRPVFL